VKYSRHAIGFLGIVSHDGSQLVVENWGRGGGIRFHALKKRGNSTKLPVCFGTTFFTDCEPLYKDHFNFCDWSTTLQGLLAIQLHNQFMLFENQTQRHYITTLRHYITTLHYGITLRYYGTRTALRHYDTTTLRRYGTTTQQPYR
jgi:hypothetical protein